MKLFCDCLIELHLQLWCIIMLYLMVNISRAILSHHLPGRRETSFRNDWTNFFSLVCNGLLWYSYQYARFYNILTWHTAQNKIIFKSLYFSLPIPKQNLYSLGWRRYRPLELPGRSAWSSWVVGMLSCAAGHDRIMLGQAFALATPQSRWLTVLTEGGIPHLSVCSR